MAFLDALLGRTRPPRARLDPLFALSTAWVTLQAELGWEPAGRAGLVLRPVAGQGFEEADAEVKDLLQLAAQEMGSKVKAEKDKYGYQWLLLEDRDWEDLVALAHMAGSTLVEKGFGEQLLAAAFRLESKKKEGPLYLIYSYKRGAFYPFLPKPGGAQERDNAEEMRLYAMLEKELPWEKDQERWYPLWGSPV